MDDLLTPTEMYEMYQELENPVPEPPLDREPLTPIEILYTVFEDHYDETSIDAVYMMAGCQFDDTYNLLMFPFWTAIETEPATIKPVNKQPIVVYNQPMVNQKERQPRQDYERKPTTACSLADFIVPDRRNHKHKRK